MQSCDLHMALVAWQTSLSPRPPQDPPKIDSIRAKLSAGLFEGESRRGAVAKDVDLVSSQEVVSVVVIVPA